MLLGRGLVVVTAVAQVLGGPVDEDAGVSFGDGQGPAQLGIG